MSCAQVPGSINSDISSFVQALEKPKELLGDIEAWVKKAWKA